MQQTLTVCVFLTENFEEETNYDFLLDQDWSLATLFVIGDFENVQKFQIKYPALSFDYSLIRNFTFENIQTKFMVFCAPFEYWDKKYVKKTYEFLRGKAALNILYQTGFLIQNENRVEYSQIALNDLKTPFSIDKLFYQNAWFSHFFKFIYSVSVLKDFKISLNLEDGFYKSNIFFNINYLAAIYQLNAFSAPSVDYSPASFLTPLDKTLSKNDIYQIRQYLFLKRNIWLKNPWNRVAWACWWFERYYKI